jgi:hypothetical protein
LAQTLVAYKDSELAIGSNELVILPAENP